MFFISRFSHDIFSLSIQLKHCTAIRLMAQKYVYLKAGKIQNCSHIVEKNRYNLITIRLKASYSMNHSSFVTGYFSPAQFRWSHTDLVRFWVIVMFIISIIGVAYLSISAGYGNIVPQLFYFPILYTAYFYPDRSMYVACSCGIAYSFIAAFFVVPELFAVAGIIVQAVLFVVIAAGSAIVLNHRENKYPDLPSDDAEAVQTMITAGESEHIEFKLQSLWSADLTNEEILASESVEIRKYRNNASKFIIARSIACFLNSDGGDIIIGILEDRKKNKNQIVGIEDDYRKLHDRDRNPDGYRRMIVDSIIQKYLPDIVNTASRFIHISFPSLCGRTLCHLRIMPSDKPVFVTIGNEELFFIRVDASTRSITGKVLTQYILTRFSTQ